MKTKSKRSEKRKLDKKECFRLFDGGRDATDLIIMGLPRATAYSWHRNWKVEKARSNNIEEGEMTAKLFSLFKEGKTLVDVVIETKLPYDDVAAVLEAYIEASETLVLRADDVKLRVNRFTALSDKVEELRQNSTIIKTDMTEYEQLLSVIKSKAQNVERGLKALEELM
ncbi:MAG: hypothetical protein IH932_01480, partial [Thaumarchaeota archaeon]|nr:hypothetical protein [Nitrososphaerota archaeon]